MQTGDFDDVTALREMANGNVDAFSIIFERHYAGLYHFLRHVTKDDQLAEDLTQEVFIKVWERRADMRDISYLKSYLCSVGRNLAFNYLKRVATAHKAAHNFAADLPDRVTPIEDQLISEELDQAIARRLRIINKQIEALPKGQRQIFKLATSGKSHKDIADMLDIAAETVKTQVKNARNNLRVGLSGHPDFHKN